MKSIPLGHTLETERLILRISSNEEIDFVWDAVNSPGFLDGMMWNRPESKEELQRFSGNAQARWLAGDAYTFTFCDRLTGEPLGRILAEKRFSKWNFGFWTHPKKQGAGYATEALSAILSFGFLELGIREATASHASWNLASKKVLENNGFRFRMRTEDGFERGGEWIALDSLSLSKDRWYESHVSSPFAEDTVDDVSNLVG
ncbi:GNAT family N-acetyltransferase [Pelagicoccus albus]|uniref:GNAT family N-acetyltransferase n=1 Tax=Pelagicoccus albus TaxID=415222 RepID=A0A7X1B8S6_9BACT|nr:GNAT family protein [Pelagicoccus albus]MBC2607766.1 GNAT family N-acetyltransferase [Pelagicoccus albus]